MVFEGFCGPTYSSFSRKANCERAINIYPEGEAKEGKQSIVFYPTPGVELWKTINEGPVRCLWAGENRVFAVGGRYLYEATAGVTNIGQIDPASTVAATPTTPAQIFSNAPATTPGTSANQLFVVSGITGTCVPEPGAPLMGVVPAVMGAFIDGYFIAQQPDSNMFRLSALNDGATWPLDVFGAKTGAADRLRAIYGHHRELWLFGAETTEVWTNTGGSAASPFPFAPIQGATIEHGITAPWSVATLDDTIVWLGKDVSGGGVVWRARGWVPQRISNHALEQELQRYARLYSTGLTDAVGYTEQVHGHSWYVLNFPSANHTWVFDATTNMWHERVRFTPVTLLENAQGYRCHCYAFDIMHLVGSDHLESDNSAKIYRQEPTLNTDINGGNLRRIRTAPHMSNEDHKVFYSRFAMDMETGLSGAGLTPQITLEYSNDGGVTYLPGRTISASQIGQYRYRAMWRRLGSSRDRVFRVTVEENMRICWVGAYLDISPGTK